MNKSISSSTTELPKARQGMSDAVDVSVIDVVVALKRSANRAQRELSCGAPRTQRLRIPRTHGFVRTSICKLNRQTVFGIHIVNTTYCKSLSLHNCALCMER